MNVFISSPISSFNSQEYKKYKSHVLQLIDQIKQNHYVFSEIETIKDIADYDQPCDSICIDFDQIKKSDYFIMYYPFALPTSSLIELGYALAIDIPVIIVTPSIKCLPYLAQGIKGINSTSTIIETKVLDETAINKIKNIIDQ